MKKILLAFGVLLIVALLFTFAKMNGEFGTLFTFGAQKTATINNQTYKLLIADTDKSRMVGLSNRNSLPQDQGMLFVFEKKGTYNFWMRDTKIPLDLIYINDNKIVDIIKNAQPQAGKDAASIPVLSPKAEANYVLEINAGLSDKHQFKTGDTVTITGLK